MPPKRDVDATDLVAAYQKWGTLRAAGLALGVCPRRVRRAVLECGLSLKRQRKAPKLEAHLDTISEKARARAERDDRIVELYQSGLTLMATARRVGLEARSVQRILRERGVGRRRGGPRNVLPSAQWRQRAQTLKNQLQTLEDAARELALDRSHFYALCRQGKVPGALRIPSSHGGTWLILRGAVAFIKTQRALGQSWDEIAT